jgi:Copper amine oxidase N-terminal domain
MNTRHRVNLAASVVAILLVSVALCGKPQLAVAQDITVIVNGQQVQFDQPPVERSGRVFVPLRGVFEQLGASVVYDNGVINATGNGTTIQLHVGSTSALVNGNSQQLDVAPFEIGSRTFVPLRFISQALGASVDYNDNTNTITIASASATNSNISLVNLSPAPGAAVSANRPGVSGSFSAPVDPNSVHITLDGRDVSATTDISRSGFMFRPPYSLIPGPHRVRVTGQGRNGSSFDQSWSFTSGANTQGNY